MGKSVWFFNAHPDDINAGSGLALVLKEMKEYDLHIGAYTRGKGFFWLKKIFFPFRT